MPRPKKTTSKELLALLKDIQGIKSLLGCTVEEAIQILQFDADHRKPINATSTLMNPGR